MEKRLECGKIAEIGCASKRVDWRTINKRWVWSKSHELEAKLGLELEPDFLWSSTNQ